MKADQVISVCLKIYRKNDPNLPDRLRYRKNPLIEFKFRDEAGRVYSKSKAVKFIDLHGDCKQGLAAAREYEKSIRRKLALETLDLDKLFKHSAGGKVLTLGAFCDGYLKERARLVDLGNLSPGTLRADRDSINRFVRVLGANYPLSGIDKEMVEGYLSTMLKKTFGHSGKTYKRTTLNLDLRHLGAAFNSAHKNGTIPANPFAVVKKLPVEKIPRALSEDEEKIFFDYLEKSGNVAWVDFVTWGRHTGMRIGEIFDADLNLLEPHKIGGQVVHFLKVYGKGSKLGTRWRWVPVDNVIEIIHRRRALMDDARQLKKYLFSLKTVDYLSARARASAGKLFFEYRDPMSINQFFRRARKACGLPNTITPHSLRHTFAVRFLEDDLGDIYKLSQILGHSTVKTTEIYLHATPKLLGKLKAG